MTQEKNLHQAIYYYRIGTGLLWLGVLTWVPFILLRSAGSRPSFFLFLPFHLAGVIGGSKLRKSNRALAGIGSPRKTAIRSIGHLLIFIGILVWAPYFYLKLTSPTPVEVDQFLPYHLACVLSGSILLLINFFFNRRNLRSANEPA